MHLIRSSCWNAWRIWKLISPLRYRSMISRDINAALRSFARYLYLGCDSPVYNHHCWKDESMGQMTEDGWANYLFVNAGERFWCDNRGGHPDLSRCACPGVHEHEDLCRYRSELASRIHLVVIASLIFDKIICADADVRLARRIRRDTLERGRDVNGVIEQASF